MLRLFFYFLGGLLQLQNGAHIIFNSSPRHLDVSLLLLRVEEESRAYIIATRSFASIVISKQLSLAGCCAFGDEDILSIMQLMAMVSSLRRALPYSTTTGGNGRFANVSEQQARSIFTKASPFFRMGGAITAHHHHCIFIMPACMTLCIFDYRYTTRVDACY